ncbi:hypothetical protein JXR93_14655 [bacterium]|nr:hypothetical protein [bacterium]
MNVNLKLRSDYGLLTEKTHALCVAVVESLKRCKRGFITQNEQLLKQTIEYENRVDQLEIEVRKSCEQILLRWQPVSKGLRFILANLSVASNLEKIGDLIEETAKIAQKHLLEEYILPTVDFEKLFDLILVAFNYSISSFLHNQQSGKLAFLETIEDISNLGDKISLTLNKSLKNYPDYVEQIVDLVLISKNLKLTCELILHIVSLSSYKEYGFFDEE